ncbi:unnamed protein product [Mytilus coruscus]|uniref:Endonuclease/exonuclease/phosphatase domain-containing protein n=1 Tax=Mytilus coruscus TaxID=42192 RepID=A0A6J8C9W1_MYTCO|nr:unnamed protein product [Mytilus coruscus]
MNQNIHSKSKTIPIKMLTVNFQSNKSKQGLVKNLVESTKPGIVLGTETSIDSSITDNQIFPPNYNTNVTNHIPHKTARQKDSLPWLTPKTTSKVKNTKQKVQREYWNYIENIVTPKEENNQYSNMKQFWTYTNHKRTESSGMAPLRSEGLLHSHQ